VHGDPHGGNIGVRGTGRHPTIVMYDFGNVIRIDAKLRTLLKRLIFELMVRNVDAAIDVLRDMSRVVEIRDEVGLRRYLEKYIEYFQTLDVKVFKFGDAEQYATLPVKLDAIIFRVVRAFGMVEGVCKDLDPAFNYDAVFAKHAGNVFMDPAFLDYRVRADARSLLTKLAALL